MAPGSCPPCPGSRTIIRLELLFLATAELLLLEVLFDFEAELFTKAC